MSAIRRSADGLTPAQLLRVASAIDREAANWVGNTRMVEGFFRRADAIRDEALSLARGGAPE